MRPLHRIAWAGLLWACVQSLVACTLDGVVFDGIRKGARSAAQGDAGSSAPQNDAGTSASKSDASSSTSPGDAGASPSGDAGASASQGDAGQPDDAGSMVSQDPMWVRKALPYASGAAASAVLSDGLHYLGGGDDFFPTTAYRHHRLYDATSDTWSDAPADVPDGETWGARAHAYQDQLYLLGGFPNGKRLRVYTPGTNAWSSLQSPPVALRWGFASAVIGNVLYAFGGVDAAATNGVGYKYDFTTNKWTAVAPIPENHGRGTLSSAAVGDRIYVLNGNVNDGSTILQIYDSATNSWSQGAALDGHFFEAAATAVDGDKVYFFGGADNHDIVDTSATALAMVSTAVNVYDTTTDTWSTQLPMAVPKMWATAALYNGVVHVLGGLDAQSKDISDHEILTE